jgi:hypothetical protein
MKAAMAQQIARALGVRDEEALSIVGRVAEEELKLGEFHELPGGGMAGVLVSAKTRKKYEFRLTQVP